MEDYPEPNEAWLQYLRRKRQFCCLILLAWSKVEFNIDQIVARRQGISEPKCRQRLVKKDFQTKLDFLKKKRVLFQDEYDTIKKFQEYRNKLFHGEEQPFFVVLNDKEKDEIMDNAVEAAQLTLYIGFGLHGKRPEIKKQFENASFKS